jgi:formylmethanofuran dehydrogenase subunit C
MHERQDRKSGKRTQVTPLAASKRFSKYKSEKSQAVRKAAVVTQNEILGRLEGAWKKFAPGGAEFNYHYSDAVALVAETPYTSRDVTKFCLILNKFNEDFDFNIKAGIFLSALVNEGKDNAYVLPLSHTTEPLVFVGESNTKTVTIFGSLDEYLGTRMNSGDITVNGNAADFVGQYMEGGVITVNGNVSRGAGFGMNGGKIVVNGMAVAGVGAAMKDGEIIVCKDVFPSSTILFVMGRIHDYGGAGVGRNMSGGVIKVYGNVHVGSIGEKMCGGEIHIEGELVQIGNVKHGKIFHKGKLIVDK